MGHGGPEGQEELGTQATEAAQGEAQESKSRTNKNLRKTQGSASLGSGCWFDVGSKRVLTQTRKAIFVARTVLRTVSLSLNRKKVLCIHTV